MTMTLFAYIATQVFMLHMFNCLLNNVKDVETGGLFFYPGAKKKIESHGTK